MLDKERKMKRKKINKDEDKERRVIDGILKRIKRNLKDRNWSDGGNSVVDIEIGGKKKKKIEENRKVDDMELEDGKIEVDEKKEGYEKMNDEKKRKMIDDDGIRGKIIIDNVESGKRVNIKRLKFGKDWRRLK